MNAIEELQKKLELLNEEKQKAIKDGEYERGAQMRDEYYKVHQELEELLKLTANKSE